MSYYKFVITKRRGTGDVVLQFSELVFYDKDKNRIPWNVADIKCNMSAVTSSETIEKIVDGYSNTKFCTGGWGSGLTNECIITIHANDEMQYPKYYSYITGNDSPNRDPVSWKLMHSIDGASWRTIGEQTDVSITTVRNAETPLFDVVRDSRLDSISLIQNAENSSTGVNACTVTLDNCTIGNTLVLAYAVRGVGNIPALSEGWEFVGGGNVAAVPDSTYQCIYFAKKIVENTTETATVTQTTTGRIYLVCGEFSGDNKVVIRNDMANRGTSNYAVTATKSNEADVVLYAVSSSYYENDGGRAQICTPYDLEKLQGDSTQERLACWFDSGSCNTGHTFRTCNVTEDADAIVECVQLIAVTVKYLVRDGSTIYTIVDGALLEVTGELNSELFISSGVDTIPDGALLLSLTAPEVLCWTDASTVPELTATVQGSPTGAHDIVSDNIRVGHQSIYGITSVEATASDGVLFLLSFDGGAWMVYDTDSSAWVASDVGMTATDLVSIPTEAWSSAINSATYMQLKATLDGVDTVSQVKFNFNNESPANAAAESEG